MQLRTSTEAIDYINTTRIQRKRRIDESKTKTLHPRKKKTPQKLLKSAIRESLSPRKLKRIQYMTGTHMCLLASASSAQKFSGKKSTTKKKMKDKTL